MAPEVQYAHTYFTRSVETLKRSAGRVPADKHSFQPGPDARSPIAIVGHCAVAVEAMHGMMTGNTIPIKTTEEADRIFLAAEAKFKSMDEVLELLDKNSTAFIAFLEALPDSELDRVIDLPFGMGQMPLRHALTFPAHHNTYHGVQLDYLHTIWGDRSW